MYDGIVITLCNFWLQGNRVGELDHGQPYLVHAGTSHHVGQGVFLQVDEVNTLVEPGQGDLEDSSKLQIDLLNRCDFHDLQVKNDWQWLGGHWSLGRLCNLVTGGNAFQIAVLLV